ncbi:MAG TPA: hypothetical protein VEZ40_20510, partial [Pyrinomonadaceae bacterium]|nr:hypothetical protein [Pyrinomonadaceae bacterium]
RQPARAAHSGMDCADDAAAATPEIRVAARGGRSCAECCAGGSGQTPATAVVVAPEQTRVKRDAVSESARARHLFAPAPPHLSHLAPSQHAPPAPLERRHLLLGVFLI